MSNNVLGVTLNLTQLQLICWISVGGLNFHQPHISAIALVVIIRTSSDDSVTLAAQHGEQSAMNLNKLSPRQAYDSRDVKINDTHNLRLVSTDRQRSFDGVPHNLLALPPPKLRPYGPIETFIFIVIVIHIFSDVK